MHIFNSIHRSVALSVLFFFIGAVSRSGVESASAHSLYGYSGVLTIPDAYVTDRLLGFHVTYLPDKIAPYRRGVSDNHVYTGTLGFLPFAECYFSVYSAVDTEWIGNYGPEKTRSPGVKIRFLTEQRIRPALAFGFFDPDVRDLGGEFSWDTISSTFIVASKRLHHDRASITLGYGLKSERFSGENSRLRGLFGGLTYRINSHLSVMADNDTEFWSTGLTAYLWGFSATCAVTEGSAFSFRAGYSFSLPGSGR